MVEVVVSRIVDVDVKVVAEPAVTNLVMTF